MVVIAFMATQHECGSQSHCASTAVHGGARRRPESAALGVLCLGSIIEKHGKTRIIACCAPYFLHCTKPKMSLVVDNNISRGCVLLAKLSSDSSQRKSALLYGTPDLCKGLACVQQAPTSCVVIFPPKANRCGPGPIMYSIIVSP